MGTPNGCHGIHARLYLFGGGASHEWSTSMTNETRQMVREMEQTDEQGVPCHVHHPDAGGKCWRPATMEVYGLRFCEIHGENVRLGALSQAGHRAFVFFSRYNNPEIESFGGLIDVELGNAAARVRNAMPSGDEETQALLRAFPEATEEVREHVLADNEEEPGLPTFYDSTLDALYVVHECMEIAYQDGQTWLVEMLEAERESLSAHAACAYRMRQQERAGARPVG
jgi:hypothetical protein